jgi:hypothetical protein
MDFIPQVLVVGANFLGDPVGFFRGAPVFFVLVCDYCLPMLDIDRWLSVSLLTSQSP